MDDFDGFESANTTPVPDVLFDHLLAELSNAELRVVLYIIRRTRGFKKETDTISFNQFLGGITTREGKVLDKGCGIKDRTTLSKALASLEKRGCIHSLKGKDPHGDKATTLYGIRFKGVVGKSYHPVLMGSREIIPPVVGKSYHGGSENLPGVVGKSYLQETDSQLDSLQETDSQERVASPHVDALTPADFLPENNNHSHPGHNAWNCEAWRNAHDGASCADYQAYIDSGQREETPTEPRTPAIPKKGDVIAVRMQDGISEALAQVEHFEDKQHIRVNWLEPCGHYIQAWRDTGGGISHPYESTLPAQPDTAFTYHGVQAFGDYRILSMQEVAQLTVQPLYLRDKAIQIGATDGSTMATSGIYDPRGDSSADPGHSSTDQRTQAQVAIASTPGEAVVPPAAETRQSVQGPDGAAAERSSGPRASGKQLPLSLKEDEPVVRPETPAQREKRIEQRKKEIWALVEQKLETKFTRTQRLSQANVAGMENLIEDETDDETIKTALDRLGNFYRAQFNLKQFHLLVPGLFAAKAPSSATNGKAASSAGPPAFLQPTSSMRSINGLSMKGTQA